MSRLYGKQLKSPGREHSDVYSPHRYYRPSDRHAGHRRLAFVVELDDLVGRQVICATGLGPKRVAGFKSEVLITGFTGADGSVVLAVPDRKVLDGSPLG